MWVHLLTARTQTHHGKNHGRRKAFAMTQHRRSDACDSWGAYGDNTRATGKTVCWMCWSQGSKGWGSKAGGHWLHSRNARKLSRTSRLCYAYVLCHPECLKKFYPKFFWVKQGATQYYQAFLVLEDASSAFPCAGQWPILSGVKQKRFLFQGHPCNLTWGTQSWQHQSNEHNKRIQQKQCFCLSCSSWQIYSNYVKATYFTDFPGFSTRRLKSVTNLLHPGDKFLLQCVGSMR